MARPSRVGGSFAPALDSSKVSNYRSTINAYAPSHLKETLVGLCDMVDLFNLTPPSTNPPRPHPIAPKGTLVIRGLRERDAEGKETGKQLKPDVSISPRIIDLEDAEIARIWDAVPWPHEVDALQAELDKWFADETASKVAPKSLTDLRNAAYHLVWYARELTLDREPLTAESVKA
jgi:hypothetical protein